MSSRLFHSAPGYMHPVSTTKPHHPTRTFSFSHSLPRIELNGDRSRNPGMESNQDRTSIDPVSNRDGRRDGNGMKRGSARDRTGIETVSNRIRTGIEPDSNRIRTGIGTEDLRFEPGTWQSFSPASFRSLSPKLLTSLLLHRPFSFALC